MIELLDFQEQASNQIVDRVVDYHSAPVIVGRGERQRHIPFIQLLNSITASGKTLILADAVSAIAKRLPIKPVVLWLSKASVVVAQSYANLDAGGAYHDLLDGFEIRPLADYDESALASSADSSLFFATTGTFNQEKRGKGTLNVFKSAIDDAEKSTWESLKQRLDGKGYRRPLLIVYDEAHNLSDQQTTLLLELEPDAFLLSTATNRLPPRFESEVINHLKSIGSMTDGDLVVQVDAAAVARSGLIKNEINLIGRQAPMQDVVAEMVKDMRKAAKCAVAERLDGVPKAVYVCRTNIAEDSGDRDNPKQPFGQRQSPPILIWRHLTEKLKVDPGTIAVYCDLKTDKAYPLPDDFVLFKGGDGDYEAFVRGGFEHIIFNQSLQEGWDDPFVYFAYIDKSMGSRVQAEQIIGRLLRQPGRHHYADQRLNTAEILVRVEAAGVFEEVVSSVEQKIRTGKLDIKVTISRPGAKAKEEFAAKGVFTVPQAAIITDRAEKRIAEFIEKMTDYRNDDGTNTRGQGKRASVQREVGGDGGNSFVWEEYGESASVLARWLFAREVARIHKGALGVAVTSKADGKPTKFDAKVGFSSAAASHIADVARKVGNAFVDQVYLKLRGPNPYEVGPVLVDPAGVESFKNAIHKGYDDLNPLESDFAHAVDQTKLTWCRNPSRSGYSIPLPQSGKTFNFFPDFLIWKGEDVYAIDTKGSHLHGDAARKLVSIKPANGSTRRVFVRFISDGVVEESGPQADSSGYTAWSFKPNGTREFTHCESLQDALKACLEPDV
jgi:type III restriction enzyme